MYRLYAQKRDGSHVKISQKDNIEEIQKIADRLKASEYYSYIIIENDGEGDRIFDRQELSTPVKIEYVDYDPTDIEIKTNSRAKQKAELRRMTKEYEDRWN